MCVQEGTFGGGYECVELIVDAQGIDNLTDVLFRPDDPLILKNCCDVFL